MKDQGGCSWLGEYGKQYGWVKGAGCDEVAVGDEVWEMKIQTNGL